MTQSCWLSSELLLVLSRVDLLFAGNAKTNVNAFHVIENNNLVSMLTFIYNFTNGQAGKLISVTFLVRSLSWVALRFRSWQGSSSCVLERVTLLQQCPLGPKANLTKCSNSMHCDSDSGIPPRIQTLFRPKSLGTQFWKQCWIKESLIKILMRWNLK